MYFVAMVQSLLSHFSMPQNSSQDCEDRVRYTDATGSALHRLHKSKPSINTVNELIQGIPDALSIKNEKDQLPIQSVVWNRNSVRYVPILAKVGTIHEVGGRGMRGGLLVVDPTVDDDDWNPLQVCACVGCAPDPIPCDTAYLEVFY